VVNYASRFELLTADIYFEVERSDEKFLRTIVFSRNHKFFVEVVFYLIPKVSKQKNRE